MSTIATPAPFKKVDGLDKKYKPLILKWLAKQFGYENYPHSYKDQWISWEIWDRILSIRFDTRPEEQKKLLAIIPSKFRGAPRTGALTIVNEDLMYLDLKQLVSLKYPQIISWTQLNREFHKDNDGDVFYTYDWLVFLDDDTSIIYHNQKDTMDLQWRDWIYDSTIQQTAFCQFLDKLK